MIDSSEFVQMAKVRAAIEANNLLHYDESLDSGTVISVCSAKNNVDPGVTKEFIRRIKQVTNWRLSIDQRGLEDYL